MTSPASPVNMNVDSGALTISKCLRKALTDSLATTHPVKLFEPTIQVPPSTSTLYPTLSPTTENNIFLFPGSFNPPHTGHLATINYFSHIRSQLSIRAFFIFADPSAIIASKSSKAYNSIILPQELRNSMFAAVPEVAALIAEGWLYILVGDMEGHITVLRDMTDEIVRDGIDVKLVGLLGGDKLSIDSAPHLPPGDLGSWGPLDEFFITNARRPVDFYDPGDGVAPQGLPGCTEWKSERSLTGAEDEAGKLWVCKALTVPGEPVIRFRACSGSASTGISSTTIRRAMVETDEEDLCQCLGDQVLSSGMLIEWLKKYRGDQKAGTGDRKGLV